METVWGLMTSGQRREIQLLLLCLVAGACLEMAGVGLLFPLLALLASSERVLSHPPVSSWLAHLPPLSPRELIVTAMGAFLVVNVARAAFLAWLAWRQSRFLEALTVALSARMYAGYLAQPCTFHLQRNSAQLIRNATGEVANVAVCVQNTLGLASEALVAVGLTGLLLLVDPAGVVSLAALLGLAAWWFHGATQHRILRWAEAGQHHEGLRLQHLQQGLGGIKEVKLLGVEGFMLEAYAPHNVGSAGASQRHVFLTALPRLWLEMLLAVGLSGYVIALIAGGATTSGLVPTLGLLGASAFRLMPSTNRMIQAVQGIRFTAPSLRVVREAFDQLGTVPASEPAAAPASPFQATLELDGVSFTYPEAVAPALAEVTLCVPRGASVGLVGGSGAGKSTLVDVILGLLVPTAGVVRVDGVELQTQPRVWQSQVGYVPQTIYLTDDTLRRNIAFGEPDGQIDDAAVWRAARQAQLEPLIEQLPLGLDTPVGERGARLSGGQRQRVGVARALYRNPAVLVLDEATSALDHDTEAELMRAVEALRGTKTLLIVAHRLSTVARCDVIHRLAGGRIVQSGPPATVLLDERPTHSRPGEA